LKKNKPWYDEGCSKLLDQRKQAKLQWLQDPCEVNGDNRNSVRREANRHFRNKKRKYLKDKIKELATNSKKEKIIYRYNSVVLVHKRTIPTERPPLVGEGSANFFGYRGVA
jgi:hypothetical protein